MGFELTTGPGSENFTDEERSRISCFYGVGGCEVRKRNRAEFLRASKIRAVAGVFQGGFVSICLARNVYHRVGLGKKKRF